MSAVGSSPVVGAPSSRSPRIPRSSSSSVVTLEAVAVALIVVVGAVTAWLRLPASARATLWAEDSRDFLGNAVAQGPVAPLFRVYAGYLHTVPRLIAGFTVTFVPIAHWAQAMAFGSCLVVGVVAAAVYVCSRAVASSRVLRLGLAAITVLAPLAPREVLGNTANLHWYFLWLAPWLILYRSPTRRGTIALTVLAAFAALTEIQMLVFVPLLLLRWRSGARLPVRIALLAGGAAQVVASLSSPRGHSTAAPNDATSVAYGWLINGVMTIWNANGPTIGRALVAFGPGAAIACLLPIVVAAVWALRFGGRDQRWLVVTFLVASVALWVIAVRTSPGVYYEYSSETRNQIRNPWLSRYGVVPSMELIAVMVVALGVRARPRDARVTRDAHPTLDRVRRAAPRLVLGVVLVAVVLVSFVPAGTRRSGGPEFAPQVAAAERFCEGKPATTPVVLASPPKASWKIFADCAWFPTTTSTPRTSAAVREP